MPLIPDWGGNGPWRVPVEITVGRQEDSSSEKHWWIIHGWRVRGEEREDEGLGAGGRKTQKDAEMVNTEGK